MKTPLWLAEFHRRWHAARGRRVTESNRAFSVDWMILLDAAGITSAEDQATAAREAEACGQLVLKRHRYRKYLIERVTLPLAAEPWLIEKFGGTAGGVLQASALEIVAEFSRRRPFASCWKNCRPRWRTIISAIPTRRVGTSCSSCGKPPRAGSRRSAWHGDRPLARTRRLRMICNCCRNSSARHCSGTSSRRSRPSWIGMTAAISSRNPWAHPLRAAGRFGNFPELRIRLSHWPSRSPRFTKRKPARHDTHATFISRGIIPSAAAPPELGRPCQGHDRV